MTETLLRETRIALTLLAQGQNKSTPTWWRWTSRGVKGHVLESFSCGGLDIPPAKHSPAGSPPLTATPSAARRPANVSGKSNWPSSRPRRWAFNYARRIKLPESLEFGLQPKRWQRSSPIYAPATGCRADY